MGAWVRRALSPPPAEQAPARRLDPAEAEAFTEQARWLHAYHERRSDSMAQRGATLLGFVSVTAALLPAGFSLGKDEIDFTNAVRVTVVVALVLLLVSAALCLRTMALRKATVQNAGQLRRQWHDYATGHNRGLVHAQITHSYLGGHESVDPIATAASEADSRVCAYKWAMRCVAASVVLLAALTTQILLQHT